MSVPLVTVAVPSYNQGQYLDEALSSIFASNVPVEVFVADGGSTDGSVDVIKKWESRLAGWRSHADSGQAAAINECIAKGSAPYICWLNSDDYFLESGLENLVVAIESTTTAPAVYGRAWNVRERDGKQNPVWVESFSEHKLARRCIVSQPATLIRRSAWELVHGLNPECHMAMDYDLWWKLFKTGGNLFFLDRFVAVNREHLETKTSTKRSEHYREAMAVVREYHGSVPLKWWLYQPYSVWFKALVNRLERD